MATVFDRATITFALCLLILLCCSNAPRHSPIRSKDIMTMIATPFTLNLLGILDSSAPWG